MEQQDTPVPTEMAFAEEPKLHNTKHHAIDRVARQIALVCAKSLVKQLRRA